MKTATATAPDRRAHTPARETPASVPPAPSDRGERGEKTRFNVMQPVYREGREKPFWQRLGTAFENPGKNGSPASISVKLDALPMSGDLVLFVAEDQQEQ
jgi:hypothetical protein